MRMRKVFVFAGSILTLGVLFWSFDVFDVKERLTDPCYGSFFYESPGNKKDVYYEIRGDRVCMEYRNNGVMMDVKTLEGADPLTFKKISDGYFSDKNSVYYHTKKIVGATPKTFQGFDRSYYKKDDAHIFYEGVAFEADYNSFEPIDKNKGYCLAKDKNRVYYCGKEIAVEDASSFEMLDDLYGKDRVHVYHFSSLTNVFPSLLKEADPQTFELVRGVAKEYAKDRKHVYYFGKLIEGADPESFVPCNINFARDKNHIYYGEKPLQNLDVNNFEQIGTTDYFRDSDSLYYLDREVTDVVDVSAFRIVPYKKECGKGCMSEWSSDCGTDGHVVICSGEPITGGEIMSEQGSSTSTSFSRDLAERTFTCQN